MNKALCGLVFVLLFASCDIAANFLPDVNGCSKSLTRAELLFLNQLPLHEIIGLAGLCDLNHAAGLTNTLEALSCVAGRSLEDLRSAIAELGFSDDDANPSIKEEISDMSRVILIDCFPYNGEMVVPLRLQTVYAYVDEIVIVEAWQSYTQLRKKDVLFFEKHKDRFAPYMDKIKFLPIHIPEDAKLWVAEEIVRSYPTDYIRQRWRERSYIVHFSDADEIPTTAILGELRGLYHQVAHRFFPFSLYFALLLSSTWLPMLQSPALHSHFRLSP